MASRESRRYKRRGVSISFGDIMLPFVGIVAIGLLVVAGKLFFVSGVRVDRNAVLLARNRQPVEPGAAQAETGERKVVPPSPEGTGDSSAFAGASSDAALNGKPLGQRRVSMTLDVLAIPYGDVSSEKAGQKAASPKKEAAPRREVVSPKKDADAPRPAGKRVNVVVSPPPRSRKTPVEPPKASPPPSPRTARKAEPGPAPTRRREVPVTPPAPPKQAPNPKSPPWRVQVGAFSTKESAVEISRKLSQSGYKVSILSGVRFHRVVVQAGSSRQDALTLASRLHKEGFPDAFSIPPASP